MNNFIKRTLTGIIFVGVLLGGIFYNVYSFAALFCIITGLALWEFYGLLKHYENATLHRVISTLGGMYLFFACFLKASGLADNFTFLPYVLFLMYIFIHELYTKAANPINNWAFTLLAQIYCAGSFSLLNFIAVHPGTFTHEPLYTPLFILAIFVFVWLNDTGAFLVGSAFGKRKLFERISPKKSWEGFWGGLVIVLIASQAFAWYAPAIGRLHWLGLAAVIVLFATWGDLTESLLKRTLGVKDSGNVLPGHGGILDRFDSVLMASPAAYCYLEFFIRN